MARVNFNKNYMKNKLINIIFLYIVFFIILLGSSCKSKMVVHVPQGYQGFIIIFYNQIYERGTIKKDWTTYHFYPPNDGILFTQYSAENISETEVVDFYGKKLRLLRIVKEDNIKIDDKILYIGDNRCAMSFDLIQIGTAENIEKMKHIDEKGIDDLYNFKCSGIYSQWLKKNDKDTNEDMLLMNGRK